MRYPIRLRRKLVRRSGGRARRRLIWSRSARSLSFFRASSFSFRVTRFFMQRLLENIQRGGVSRASRGSFTLDDIRQIRDQQLRAIKIHFLCPAPKTGQRTDSMDFAPGEGVHPFPSILRVEALLRLLSM